jgi:hypothetical protein
MKKTMARPIMGTIWIACTLLATLVAPASAQPAKLDPQMDPQKTGRQYTTWFYTGEIDRIWERFSPEMKKAMGSVETLRAFRTQVESQIGTETSILNEKVSPVDSFQVYTRKAKFSKAPMTIVVEWTLSGDGTIAGFFVRPEQKEAAGKSLN